MELFMRHIVLGCLLTLFSTILFAQLKNRFSLIKFERTSKKMGNEIDQSERFFNFGA